MAQSTSSTALIARSETERGAERLAGRKPRGGDLLDKRTGQLPFGAKSLPHIRETIEFAAGLAVLATCWPSHVCSGR